MTSSTGSLHVWSWYTEDAALDQLVVFVTAARRPGDLKAVGSRLQLAELSGTMRLHPSSSGYVEAAATPLQALWMPLDQFAALSRNWRHEDQLAEARLMHALSHGR